MILYILLTLRTMFKCPFCFGFLFVNNLFCVWYVISIFFSAFDFTGMLLVGGREFRWPVVPVTFYGLYLYLSKTCSFCKFYGPDDQFLLLFTCGAVNFIALAVLRVCSLRRLYSLVIFRKAVDFIALFIYGFLEPISFCWAR